MLYLYTYAMHVWSFVRWDIVFSPCVVERIGQRLNLFFSLYSRELQGCEGGRQSVG